MSLEHAAPAPFGAPESTPPATPERTAPAAPVSRAAVLLVGLAFAALAGAGLLLWSVQGPAVFNDVVLAALAWCF